MRYATEANNNTDADWPIRAWYPDDAILRDGSGYSCVSGR